MGAESGRGASSRRVVISGRDQLLLQGMVALLKARGWKPESCSPEEVAAAVRKVQAALLILDVGVLGDVRLVAAARKAVKNLRVMATVGERNSYLVRELQGAGATVVIHRATSAQDVEKGLEAALGGGSFLCGLCQSDVASAGRSRRALSPRETEVLRLLGYGNTNKIVAQTLHISEKTVEAHRANIKRKLGARGLSDLVRYAISVGLVDTRDPIPAN